jgi:hypothetical protein
MLDFVKRCSWVIRILEIDVSFYFNDITEVAKVKSGCEVVRLLCFKVIVTIQTFCINEWRSTPNGKP